MAATAKNVYKYTQDKFWGYVDAIITPQKREQLTKQATAFAKARPYAASYAAVFTFFAFAPVMGFAIFLVSLAIVLAATALFWVGLGLIVTTGLLSVAALFATGAYLYLVSLFFAYRWARTLLFGASGRPYSQQKKYKSEYKKTERLTGDEKSDDELLNGESVKKERGYGAPQE